MVVIKPLVLLKYQVCKRFGELPDNLKDKLKYSTWRATEIQKAKREGRTPDPPTPLEDTDPFIDSHTNANEQNDVTDEEAAAALDSALAAPPSEDLPPSPNHSGKTENDKVTKRVSLWCQAYTNK